MGSIKSQKYPEHDIEKAVEIIELIHNNGISKPELLADQLGHSSSEGGAFRNKITSLRRYGLVAGRGDLTLTPLSERIVAPKPGSNERQTAIAEAVLNVDLLEQMYERLDYSVPSEDIWYDLVEITGCERAEAQEKASDIRGLYEAGLQYVQNLEESESASEENLDETSSTQTTVSSSLSEIPDDIDARLITPDAQIDVRNSATYAAASALFNEIGRKYQSDDSKVRN